PDLPPGTLEVELRDARGGPLPAEPLELVISTHDVAEGDSTESRSGTTDSAGRLRFDRLPTDSAHSYRLVATRGPATFSSEEIRLTARTGSRSLLHVYPVTRNLKEALVGLRGVVYVQPREDVFQIETNFQVLNIGRSAWVPEGIRLELPPGVRALRAGEGEGGRKFEKIDDRVVELRGTFAPGQSNLGFQFQVENRHEASVDLTVPVPPHVAELRVIAEQARGMSLRVAGMPPAEPTAGQDGARLLVTGKRLVRGDAMLAGAEITLSGLPERSRGRWYAAALALAVALGGLARAVTRRGGGAGARVNANDAAQAEELLFAELERLEQLRAEGVVGPRTYDAARMELLDAIARIAHQRAAPAAPG
ncbi:MAG: hypothetical protein FJ104_07790, partial [Deltaproteobacteria bacterium]|nr:hypothetical protein [Deltaproteobacteria bacterium]